MSVAGVMYLRTEKAARVWHATTQVRADAMRGVRVTCTTLCGRSGTYIVTGLEPASYLHGCGKCDTAVRLMRPRTKRELAALLRAALPSKPYRLPDAGSVQKIEVIVALLPELLDIVEAE
jgi:hypothetical protein